MHLQHIARDQTSAKGAVSDDGHAELAGGMQQVDLRELDVERERRVFDLQRGDRMLRVGAPEGGRRTLGEANVLDFASSGWGVSM